VLEAMDFELHIRPAGHLPVLGETMEDDHA
jgi:hypothetical protein